MTQGRQQFVERWRAEKEFYKHWGEFVRARVFSLLGQELEPQGLGVFIRIPVEPRVKVESSLVQKAFVRKNYQNPYEESEDKVGVRFVVLLNQDVSMLGSIIERDNEFWTVNKARDFLLERNENPSVFEYQSLHYVVRSKPGVLWDDKPLLEDMPCEIQIRTLMQHAYSELTHDTIYKPTVTATPEMRRAAAKSMALIEATDDYFSEVVDIIKKAEKSAEEIKSDVFSEYRLVTGKDPTDSPLNTLLIDHYKAIVGEDFAGSLSEWIQRKPYIGKFVRDHAEDYLLGVPAILLVLYAIAEHPSEAKLNSPLSDDELNPLYSLLGLAMYG